MDKRNKKMLHYIIPATGELAVTYLYNVVDDIFVGRGTGPEGLGAVNLAVPFITIVVAIVAMFPMGGATIAAISQGKKDEKTADQAFMTALGMTLIISVFLMLFGMVFSRQIVCLNGADHVSLKMRNMADKYLFWYSAFSIPMLMSTCLSVFVRNDGSPVLSFVGMCAGAAANIFLDWLLIFLMKMGTNGAAIASGIGQIFSLIILLSHFRKKKGMLRIKLIRMKKDMMQKICRQGFPEAVTQMTTPVTALCFNLMLSRLIGDIGVSTFSVLSFISSLVNAALSGVAQGLQPLWGNACGREDRQEVRWYLKRGLLINSVLSVLITVVLYIRRIPVIQIFNSDEKLIQYASEVLPAFSLSFLPMAWNLILTSCFYSTRKSKEADLIAVSRGIILKIPAICGMPMIFNTEAIWMAPFIAELITLVMAVVLLKRMIKNV